MIGRPTPERLRLHTVPHQDSIVRRVRDDDAATVEVYRVREPEPVTGVRAVGPLLRGDEIRLPQNEIRVSIRRRVNKVPMSKAKPWSTNSWSGRGSTLPS